MLTSYPALIASGPTLPDFTTASEANEIVRLYNLDLTPSTRRVLTSARGATDNSVAAADVRIIAAPSQALAAASEAARLSGLAPLVLGDAIEGESRELGVIMC